MDERDNTAAEIELNPIQKGYNSALSAKRPGTYPPAAHSPATSTNSGNVSDSSAISVGDDTEMTAASRPPGFSDLGRMTLGAEEGNSKYNSTFYRHAGLVRTPSGRWRQQVSARAYLRRSAAETG